MEELIKAIGNRDKHEFALALETYVKSGDHNIDNLCIIFTLMPEIVEKFKESHSVQSGKKTIIWHEYENIIWMIGESIRQILKIEKKLRRNKDLYERIEEICLNQSFGKGRQSFIMLMGQYGSDSGVQSLIELLPQEDVSGHAIYSLRLLKAKEAEEFIKQFLESKNTWIRNEAKKYFEKINRA